MTKLVNIDGSQGEGGGQILRSALALSLVTGIPFQIDNIRSGRQKPGLMRQHLTAVTAATQIGAAEVSGDAIGSRKLRFVPQGVFPGHYHFSVGTAGSATLVLQTLLPALVLANAPSTLILEGGTHNPFAPPYDFLEKTFLPLLARQGPDVSVRLDRPGFYPAGGGRFRAEITPVDALIPLEIIERGEIKRRGLTASVAKLSVAIAEREISAFNKKMNWPPDTLYTREIIHSLGPGNIVTAEIESNSLTEVISGFGRRGVTAETVGKGVAVQVDDYLKSGVPVGRYLADQLLIPMAVAGGGVFRTMALSKHSLTNMEVIKAFLPVCITVDQVSDGAWEVRLTG